MAVISIVMPTPISGNGTVACGIFANVSVIAVIVFSGRSATGDMIIASDDENRAISVTVAPKNIASGIIGKIAIFAGTPIMDTSPIAYAK